MSVLDRLRSIMDEARYRQYARSPTRIYFTYRAWLSAAPKEPK